MKVFERSKEFTEETLLGLAANRYFSTTLLCTHPICFFDAGFLLHLSLELILKACCLCVHNKFSGTHKLFDLLDEIPLKLDEVDVSFVCQLETLHHLRYEFNEVGTHMQSSFSTLVDNILAKMPEKLRNIWNAERENIEVLSSLIPQRVYNDLNLQYSPFVQCPTLEA